MIFIQRSLGTNGKSCVFFFLIGKRIGIQLAHWVVRVDLKYFHRADYLFVRIGCVAFIFLPCYNGIPWQISCMAFVVFRVGILVACGQINVLLKRDQHVSWVCRSHATQFQPLINTWNRQKYRQRQIQRKTSGKLIPEYDICDTLVHVCSAF